VFIPASRPEAMRFVRAVTERGTPYGFSIYTDTLVQVRERARCNVFPSPCL